MTNQKNAMDWRIAESTDGLKDGRQVRALYDGLYVEATEDDATYTVHSSSGNSYTVDLRRSDCDCPDAQQRENICKHQFAAMYWTGAAPVPVDALSADKIVVDALTDDDDGAVTNLDLLDHYKLVTLDGDDPSKSIRWADDGELVAVSSADGLEPASALDAERDMIAEQEPEPEPSADDLDAEPARCGSTDTQDGSPCQRTVTEPDATCHLHGDDSATQDVVAIDDEQSPAPEPAPADDATADALADAGTETVTLTDGGRDAIADVIDAAPDGATVIVIVKE